MVHKLEIAPVIAGGNIVDAVSELLIARKQLLEVTEAHAMGSRRTSIRYHVNPIGPIGLGTRVPFIAISSRSKGGYVISGSSITLRSSSLSRSALKSLGAISPMASCGSG